MNPRVSIIILNWNGWRDTIECLESVLRNDYPNYQVVVVDNNSTDGSMEKIKTWADGKQEVLIPEPPHPLYHLSHPPIAKPIPYIEYTREKAEKGGNPELKSKLTNSTNPINSVNHRLSTSHYLLIFIQAGENLGFAGGNNVGIRYSLGKGNFEYVLLLNNDTIVEEKFLTELVKAGEKDKKTGIVGGKIYYYNKPDKLWYGGGKINLFTFRASHNVNEFFEMKPVNLITGCLMLIKTDVFKEIGLFDENYFLTVEDWDFSYRVKQKFNMEVTPPAVIYHKVSFSSGGEKSPVPMYYCYRNRWIFINKLIKNPFKKSISILFYFLSFFKAFLLLMIHKRVDVDRVIIKATIDALRGKNGKTK